MSGRYERVNAQDEEDFHNNNNHLSSSVPRSPPPSFHSRAPSPN
ncbi:metal homeostatis protein bsd2, partial [Fusarium flagelliforme]